MNSATVLAGTRRIDLHHQRDEVDAADRHDVVQEIEVELVVERGVDGVLRVDQQQRIAVGAACVAASVAMLPPAPGRVSMMNCWPSFSDRNWPIRRAVMSEALPAAWPTIILHRASRIGALRPSDMRRGRQQGGGAGELEKAAA